MVVYGTCGGCLWDGGGLWDDFVVVYGMCGGLWDIAPTQLQETNLLLNQEFRTYFAVYPSFERFHAHNRPFNLRIVHEITPATGISILSPS